MVDRGGHLHLVVHSTMGHKFGKTRSTIGNEIIAAILEQYHSKCHTVRRVAAADAAVPQGHDKQASH